MGFVEFLVQGSAPYPYQVVFKKVGSKLTGTCTCPAGENGQHCKHRIRIMEGDQRGIVSDNIDAVKNVQNWMHGTDVEKTLTDFREAEQQLEDAKKLLSVSKKRLARILMG